ncbi:MAG TPA: hypothetical protein VGZ52_05005 [Acidimicrobiales bacterium]|jgi:hypothetical protein|nr:hypothetical protein [Acidimicrobiales bacterium]
MPLKWVEYEGGGGNEGHHDVDLTWLKRLSDADLPTLESDAIDELTKARKAYNETTSPNHGPLASWVSTWERAVAEIRQEITRRKTPVDDLFAGVAGNDNKLVFDAPANTDPTLDTGHYDDGHTFGWKSPGGPAPAATGVTPEPLVTKSHVDELLNRVQPRAEPTSPSSLASTADVWAHGDYWGDGWWSYQGIWYWSDGWTVLGITNNYVWYLGYNGTWVKYMDSATYWAKVYSGWGTNVTTFVDTQVEQPTLPPNEVFTPQPTSPTLEIADAGTSTKTKVAIGGGILLACCAVAAFVLIDRGGSSTKNTSAPVVAGVTPGAQLSNSSASSGAVVAATPPPNTVLASCFQLAVSPGATMFIPTFITAPMVPGAYQVTLRTGNGDVTGSGTVASGATWAEVQLGFTRFTDITAINISGPNGPIAPGTFASQLPFPLDAAHDHPTDCDGSKLTIPVQPPSGGGADIKTQMATFLDTLANNTHSPAGVDGLMATLNRAVTDVFGVDQCRSFLATTTDPSAAFTVLDLSAPGPFDYTIGAHTTTVPDTFTVTTRHTHNGQTTQDAVHVARGSDGSLSWFTRCTSG